MTSAWDLRLTIDAHGHDATHVTTRPAGTDGQRQLIVRVGLVVVHCLDGSSAMSAGLAWATARLHARSWLPDLEDRPGLVPPPPAPTAEYGAAFPSGSILLDGRQPWQVTPTGMALAVTVGPLQVTVHDWTALDTHVRAWTEASAVATRLFPGKSMPFGRLVDQARRSATREWDAQIDRRENARRAPRREGRTRD